MDTTKSGISPLGLIQFLDFFMGGGLSEGGTLEVFLVVGRIPVEAFSTNKLFLRCYTCKQ